MDPIPNDENDIGVKVVTYDDDEDEISPSNIIQLK